MSTECDGLGIRPRCPDKPLHFGAELFNPAHQAISGIHRLVRKHPDLDTILRKIAICGSKSKW